MKKNRFVGRWATFFLAAGVFSTAFLSCKEKEEDKVKPKTVTDIILQNDDFSILREIMLHAKKGDGWRTENATFFLPDNNAFKKANIFSSAVIISMPNPQIEEFLNMHVMKKRIDYNNLPTGKQETSGKDKINITKKDSVVTVNDCDVVKKDVNADNAIIQVIDSVLVNPIK